MLSEDWWAEKKLDAQLSDTRAYYLIKAINTLRESFIGKRISIAEPGEMFPSLKGIDVEKVVEEDDVYAQNQQMRVLFSKFLQK